MRKIVFKSYSSFPATINSRETTVNILLRIRSRPRINLQTLSYFRTDRQALILSERWTLAKGHEIFAMYIDVRTLAIHFLHSETRTRY